MRINMTEGPFLLDTEQREVAKSAIEEVCTHRKYHLHAANVGTNHFHVVVSAKSKPEPIADALKSYATRKLRERRLIGDNARPWARGKSRRYLWKPKHIARAIHYVLYEQGEIPDFDD